MTGGGDGPELDLELPSKPAFVRTARHAVAAFGHLHGLPKEIVEDMKIAVSEAYTSALQVNEVAARATGTEPEPIRVLARAAPKHVQIEVLDRGSGPRREVEGSPHELDTDELPFEKALTVPVIRGLVDELEIVARDGGGAVVRMRLATPSGRGE